MKYQFDFAAVLAQWPLLLEGAWVTVQLSFGDRVDTGRVAATGVVMAGPFVLPPADALTPRFGASFALRAFFFALCASSRAASLAFF